MSHPYLPRATAANLLVRSSAFERGWLLRGSPSRRGHRLQLAAAAGRLAARAAARPRVSIATARRSASFVASGEPMPPAGRGWPAATGSSTPSRLRVWSGGCDAGGGRAARGRPPLRPPGLARRPRSWPSTRCWARGACRIRAVEPSGGPGRLPGAAGGGARGRLVPRRGDPLVELAATSGGPESRPRPVRGARPGCRSRADGPLPGGRRGHPGAAAACRGPAHPFRGARPRRPIRRAPPPGRWPRPFADWSAIQARGCMRSAAANTAIARRLAGRPARAPELMRVDVVDPSAYTPPYDHSLCAALVGAGAEVGWSRADLPTASLPAPDHYTSRELFYRRALGAARLAAAVGVKLLQHGPDMARYRAAARSGRRRALPMAAGGLAGPLLLPARPLVLTAHDLLPREPRPGQVECPAPAV